MIKNYIKEAYPYWIRNDSHEEGSITNKYDEVRWFTFDTISDEISSAAKQLLITTSDEAWILEWENFLNINWLWLGLEERRSVLLATVFWRNTTLAILKLVVYWIVWGDSDSVEFYETWTDWISSWDDLFTYEVRINWSLITNTFKPIILESTINQLQPQHCTVVIVNTSYPTAERAEVGTPTENTGVRVSEDLPFDWAIWS